MGLVIQDKHYEAYIKIISGLAGGPLVYIDSHGHIHVVPVGPDDRRVAEVLHEPVAALRKSLAAVTKALESLERDQVLVGG
jgi:hypothetical protein